MGDAIGTSVPCCDAGHYDVVRYDAGCYDAGHCECHAVQLTASVTPVLYRDAG